eukprot:453538_1
MSQQPSQASLNEIYSALGLPPALLIPGQPNANNFKEQWEAHRNDVKTMHHVFKYIYNDVPIQMRPGKDPYEMMREYSANAWKYEIYPFSEEAKEITQEVVEDQVIKVFKKAKYYPKEHQVKIFYSGHGYKNTGDWVVSGGKISWNFIRNQIYKHGGNTELFLDSCYSGNWAINLKQLEGKVKNVAIWAASYPGKAALYAKSATERWGNFLPKLFWANDDEDWNNVHKIFYGTCGMIDKNGKWSKVYCLDPTKRKVIYI